MALGAPQSLIPPPTCALPTLPSPRTRAANQTLSETTKIPATPHFVSRNASRTPSRPKGLNSPTGTDQPKSTSAIPTLRSTSNAVQGAGTSSSELHRSVSITAFPQPPRVLRRLATSPRPSPSATWPTLENNLRDSEDPGVRGILGNSLKVKKLKTKTSTNSLSQMYTSSLSPTLLDGSGDGKSVAGPARVKNSLNSLPSPPHSRSSSAHSSYSTSATTFEDLDDNTRRGREVMDEKPTTKPINPPTKESKGNVIVSVRVRPDTAGNGDINADGEWLVDGRRSLVSFRGREGGNYFYGLSRTVPK